MKHLDVFRSPDFIATMGNIFYQQEGLGLYNIKCQAESLMMDPLVWIWLVDLVIRRDVFFWRNEHEAS